MAYQWITYERSDAVTDAAWSRGPLVNSSGGKKDIALRAAWYLEERSFSLKELREVADVLGYSYSYLSHVFREEMGMSLQSYYSRIKVRKAMELLRKTDATVTRVAELLHYQSIHSFSKAFKRQTGQSPSEYQLQVWNEKDTDKKSRKIEIVYR
ncbi:helix-turn-helix transcriptional regulator [Paenibacillus sp. GD4]|uniref:helix-turn-helix transcriptional regulator n=1 Tax=Paenibacillus sp. GD4 TaxID=3068890 RepID=UPI002796B0B0|nr:helix-turn-helix transcriptional regulator [Paenibacillus sp. GD4]MDQ1910275.1 helix-turn-helix transcriptional regulator [Paenibacillus sp. GD4]